MNIELPSWGLNAIVSGAVSSLILLICFAVYFWRNKRN